MKRAPLIIGHRGDSRDAPENTLSAFRLAWQEGADGIETDLRLTRDGHIVCLHDATTGRTAGRDIRVAELTLAELQDLDVGVWKGERWRGERIPTLVEVLELSPREKRLFLEIKSGPEILPALMHELTGRDEPDRISFLSFSGRLIALLKRRMPQFAAFWLTAYQRHRQTGAPYPGHGEILAALAESGADGLASKAHDSLDAGFVADLRKRGFAVHVWTVDSPGKARHYAELGVDSIMTNRPGWLKTRLAQPDGS